MPQGDPGGNFAGTAGYGGQFGGFGGASAGYSGGYGNPSSVGGGTAGQTYAGQQYANSLNKHNPTLANYSGVGANAPGNTASAAAAYVAAAKRRAAAVVKRDPITGKPTYVDPTTGQPVPEEPIDAPLDPIMGAPPPTGIGLINPGQWPNTINPGWANYNNTPSEITNNWNAPGSIGEGIKDESQVGLDHVGGWGVGNSSRGKLGAAISGRQFGGPVAPGQQYTVGENGPETLQMSATGGGQVIPHNPMDRLGGMNPQMMQQLFQLQRLFGGAGRQGMDGQPPASPQPMPPAGGSGNYQPGMTPPAAGPPAPPRPAMGGGGSYGQPQQPTAQPPVPPTMPPTQGGSGGWQNRMGIEGLSRPMRPPPGGAGGFGLSGLGQPGVMGQLRRQGGFGGR